ncbi:MAG: ClpP family protease [Lachnospiraceae bacterium]
MGCEEKDQVNENIEKMGEVEVSGKKSRIHVMVIIGEIEGHDNLSGTSKTTKYEHLLPKLALLEEDKDCEGILLIINTVGGDVSAGLALAEMVASLSKPKVALVIGDCHSIGVPLAVSCDYSLIVPSGTMIIHPVRMSGTVIGAPQTYEYFKLIQDRILGFIASHSKANVKQLEKMMINTGILTKDLGTILVGKEAVEQGLIDAVGGINEAYAKLNELMDR